MKRPHFLCGNGLIGVTGCVSLTRDRHHGHRKSPPQETPPDTSFLLTWVISNCQENTYEACNLSDRLGFVFQG